MKMIDSFRSVNMRKRGQPAEYGLFRKIASVAGPCKTIWGDVVNTSPVAMWEHVKDTPWFATLAEAVDEWPSASVSPWVNDVAAS